MHRSTILSTAAGLASLATGSLAAVHRLSPRADCGNFTNVPLSPDPDHSSYTFLLDQSVQEFISATNTAAFTLNTIMLIQTCNSAPDGHDLTRNKAYGLINQFGPENPYTISTDRCEKEHSRSPIGYSVSLCEGDGTSCSGESSAPSIVCGPTDPDMTYRIVCPADSAAVPKAISLNDPTPWTCQICNKQRCGI
ncbi:hypothetical protein LZ30DRAFT_739786 [Colletotrichum cereale]|nr:hypothetical protein LZ30DRAFT_739786 [Colletotrichum cereale]